VKSVWRNNDRMLPLGRTPVPAEWNFAARRPVGELNVDNCFGGWSREATIIWPEQRWGVAIRADDVFSHLVVYTTPARDNIAIEPISHANNAVNLKDTYNDTGLVVLEPGETLSGAFTMRPLAGAQIDAA
jgi:aldose 1-epimerase